ncbi:MAG TPA: hydroxyacylglutathione hydrolase [Bacteriovoracaceae bacterium]|nr:hydroxyacylglutathione hydrolase [Bacteriovoracaceae bacterium]
MIQVKTFFAYNELRNYSYLLYEDTTGDAWVIDPYEANPMIKYIKENSLVLKGILNTHRHFDHIRGNQPLQEAFKSPVKSLMDADQIILNPQFMLETLDTPGHTMDHQVFILKENNQTRALFSGDTLFNSGVGNCKNGGNVDQLYQTTRKLITTLPDETLLYPGHDYAEKNLEFALTFEPENANIREGIRKVKAQDVALREPSKLGSEKMVNPFLRLTSPELRQRFIKDIKALDDTADIERNLFQTIRALRDKW